METIQREITKKDNVVRSKNFIIAIVGTNATGKTSLIMDILYDHKEEVREDGNGSYFIKEGVESIAFDNWNEFGNIVGSKIKPNDDIAKLSIRNSLVVFDNYMTFSQNNNEVEKIAKMFLSQKQDNNNFIYSCPSLNHVPLNLSIYTTHFFIFHTKNSRNPNSALAPSHLFDKATEMVNRYVSQHGLGKHVLDPSFDGQGFPYCIIDVEKQSISEINMNKKY